MSMNITAPKLKSLLELMDLGKEAVIQITQGNMDDTIDYQKGMRCRCLSYTDDSMGDSEDDLVIRIETSFEEFEEYNKLLSSPIWRSPKGNVKWHESEWYPKDKKVELWLGNHSDGDFEILVDESIEVYHKYHKQKEKGLTELSYIEWLENLAMKQLTKGVTIE